MENDRRNDQQNTHATNAISLSSNKPSDDPRSLLEDLMMLIFIALLPMLFLLSSVVHSRSVSVLGTYTRGNVVTPPPLNECSNPPRDSCSFYADCLEAAYHCGEYGYPIGYGQKYCQRFSDDRSELSAKGQVWMLDTMLCLQTQLIPEATGAVNTTCDAIKDKAFGTHAMCYVDSGLCLLPPSDWVAIVDIVGITTLFSSWDAFEATLKAGEGCAEFWAFLIEQKL